MRINVNVTLDEADLLAMTAEEVAGAVLVALGGDPTKDSSSAYVNKSGSGTAGAPVPPSGGEPVTG